MSAGVIRVAMTLDAEDFTVKTIKAGQTVEEFKKTLKGVDSATKGMGESLTTMGTKFKDLVFAVSILRFAFKDFHDIVLALPKAFLKSGGEMERMMKLMEGLSKETDDFKRKAEALSDVKFVFQFASNSPFEVKALTDTFVKLKTAGIDPTNGSMAALTNSVAKFGGSDELLKRASIAIQQMAGKGVVSMEELRQQLGEAIPNAMQLMARGLGLSMAELTKAVSKGTVNAGAAINKMLIQMEIDASGSAKRMMTTLPGMLAQLKTEFEKFKVSAVEDSGILEITKQQLQIIIDFFRSEEGKKFAQETGAALKSLVLTLVDIKDAALAAWPAIKLLGTAWLAYMGGTAVRDSITNTIKQIQAMGAAQLAAQRAPMELEKQRAVEQKRSQEIALTLNNQSYQQEVKALAASRDAQKAAQEKLEAEQKAAATELANLDKLKAKQEELLAARLRGIEMVMGAEHAAAIEQQAIMVKKGASNAAPVAKLNESPVALAARQALFEEASAAAAANVTSSKAVLAATKAETEALEKNLKAQIETRTQQVTAANAAVAATQKTVDGLAKEHNALQASIGSLNNVITSKEKLIAATSTAGATLLGFGKSMLSGLGWTAAFTAAIYAITWAYDKLTESSRKAKEEMIAVQRIKDNKTTNTDKEVIGDRLDESSAQLAKKEADLKALLDRQKQFADAGGADPYAARNKAKIAELTSDIAVLNARLVELRRTYYEATQAVNRTSSITAAAEALSVFNEKVEDALAKTEAMKRANAAAKTLQDTSPQNVAGQKKALADVTAATKAVLEERLKAQDAAYQEMLPQVSQKGRAAEAAFNKAYFEQRAKTLADIKANGVKDYLNPETPGANKRESPLIKLMEKEEADVAIARAKLNSITTETQNLVKDAQTKRAFELLRDLADGKFDYGTKESPGLEPAKNERLKFIQQLSDYIQSGGQDIIGFFNKLAQSNKDLNAHLENTKTTFADAARTILTDAGVLANTEAQIKGLTAATDAAAASQELANTALAELNAGMKYIPATVADATAHWAKMEKQLGLTGKALDDFRVKTNADVGAKTQAAVISQVIAARKAAADEQIKGIENVQERETAQYLLTLSRANDEYTQMRAYVEANIQDETRRTQTLGYLEEILTFKRTQEAQRFRMASKTETDKMLDGWKNVTGEMDKVIASSSQKWIDAIVNFVQTGKLSFGDLIKSMLADIAKIELQNSFGAAITGGIKSAIGLLPGKAAAAANAGGPTATGTDTAAAQQTLAAAAAKDVTASLNTLNKDSLAQSIQSFGLMTTTTASQVSADEIATEATFSSAGGMTMLSDLLFETTFTLQYFGEALMMAAEQAATSSAASAFANGGIMSSYGSLPLKKYSKGGVANSAQVAIFGEGDMNEAYVPLPDGRSIPVTVQGTMNAPAGAAAAAPVVNVNVINQTSQNVTATQGNAKFDGKQMILDVFISEASRPGPFRDQLRNISK